MYQFITSHGAGKEVRILQWIEERNRDPSKYAEKSSLNSKIRSFAAWHPTARKIALFVLPSVSLTSVFLQVLVGPRRQFDLGWEIGKRYWAPKDVVWRDVNWQCWHLLFRIFSFVLRSARYIISLEHLQYFWYYASAMMGRAYWATPGLFELIEQCHHFLYNILYLASWIPEYYIEIDCQSYSNTYDLNMGTINIDRSLCRYPSASNIDWGTRVVYARVWHLQ